MDAARKPIPVLVIAGPTAVGKTAFSLEVAQRVAGEIVSADSAQVYRGLDIGTAKLPVAARRGIPHHLIDVVDPTQPFSVADFQQMAAAVLEEVWSRGHLPIVVGGTGLWIRALLQNFPFPPQSPESPAIRAQLQALGERDGWEGLRRRLRIVDPESWSRIAREDHRRLIRALEVWEQGWRLPRMAGPSPYQASYWVLTRPAAELKQRVRERTRAMLAAGLVDEVIGLLRRGVPPQAQSLSAIGYREVVHWYFGRLADAEIEPLIVRKTQQYAKRQLTWLRREPQARWIDLSAWPWEEAVSRVVAAAEGLRQEATFQRQNR